MTPPPFPTVFPDFDAAAKAVLEFLQARLGYGLWMVTRTEGDDWIVLRAEDRGYNIKPGAVFRWADSFCSRMVEGLGPRVAPDAAEFPRYVEAPISRLVAIRSYVGVPIAKADGSLFGTLCAIDPEPKPGRVAAEQPLVELLAALLGTVLSLDLAAAEQARAADRARADALKDEETGLFTARGWADLLAAEERRCGRFGHPAFVAAVGLAGLPPAVVARASRAVEAAARRYDVVARAAADELAVLGVEADRAAADWFRDRLKTVLRTFDVPAAVGVAVRDPSAGLAAAWQAARRAMAEDGARRAGAADTPPPPAP